MRYLKIVCLVLSLSLLTGCFAPSSDKGRYCFFYVRNDYLHSNERTVLAAEKRTAQGDLKTILSSYLAGPENQELISPFPDGTQLVSLNLTGDCLYLTLNSNFASLSGIQLTLACGALAQTCFSISEANRLEIRTDASVLDGREAILITRDSLLLIDDSAATKETT